jgi:hypothetical protein
MKSKLTSRNVRCCHSEQNVLCSSLLSSNIQTKIYRTVILAVVLCGCGTWSLTLSEERRLRVSENGLLREVFGARTEWVTGEWRTLHN